MEKWIILLSVFKNLFKTEIKNTWWSWVIDLGFSVLKLMCVVAIGFAIWSLYSYLRGYPVEAMASAQMSGILLGTVAALIFLAFLTEKIIEKFVKTKASSTYRELFDVYSLLDKDVEKIKDLGITIFKKNPLLISGSVIAGAYLYSVIFQDKHPKKDQKQVKNQKS
jgi:hypothetical protein